MGLQLDDCICDISGRHRSCSKKLMKVEGGGKQRNQSWYRKGGDELYVGFEADSVLCA